MLHLLAHAYIKESEAFQKHTHTCFICFDSKPGRDFVTLHCGHYWCLDCLKEMTKTYVKEGGTHLQWLMCPRPDCSEEITPDILKNELLSPEEYARWEKLSLAQALDKMADVTYCPRCQTACLVDDDSSSSTSTSTSTHTHTHTQEREKKGEKANLAECPSCFFTFCPQCHDSYHAGTPCYSSAARLKQIEDQIFRLMKSNTHTHTLTPTQNAQLEKLRRAAEENLSRKVVEKNARSCPACGLSVEVCMCVCVCVCVCV
jgi:E3 ubiquitin-protein ligase RNF14